VPIRQDGWGEVEEFFAVFLEEPAGGATLASAWEAESTVLIADDDPGAPPEPQGPPPAPHSVFAFAADHYEVNEGAGQVVIPVYRTGDTSAAVEVTYRLGGNTGADGLATAGDDYTDVSGTLSFAPGEATKTITVPILDDQVAEPNETISFGLTHISPGGSTGFPNYGQINILDDNSPGVLTLARREHLVSEGAGTLTVTVDRLGSLAGAVSVSYSTAQPPLPAAVIGQYDDYPVATPGADYTHVTGTLTFADGQSSASFTVPILQDGIEEYAEPFEIRLVDPTGGATFASPSAAFGSARITDDEPANHTPVVSDDTAATPANRPVVIHVLANDTDADGDSLTIAPFPNAGPIPLQPTALAAAPVSVATSSPPAHGTAVVERNGNDDPTDDRIRYTPNPGFTGTDTFRYLVSDGRPNGYAMATVTITVGGGGGDGGPISLTVNGTDGDDLIVVAPRGRASPKDRPGSRVEVFLNGQSHGVGAWPAGVFVNAGGGNDRVRVIGSVRVPVSVDCGAGDDVLAGGLGSDMLYGGDGDDRLLAGGGHDLLAGGSGADRLLGGAGEDLLIAGLPPFNPVTNDVIGALRAMTGRWGSNGLTYAARLASVTTPNSTLFPFGTTVLNTQATASDGAVDILSGQTGGDVFFADTTPGTGTPADRLVRRFSSETVLPALPLSQ
jgi:Ca2+-binding RTX toxin-like protein